MTEALWEVPETWSWTRLDQVGQIVSGATPSTKVSEYWADEVIWFSPADLTGYRDKYISKGAKSISLLGLANSSARLFPAGSVMFSSRAPVGYVAINKFEAATNQGFKTLVPETGVCNEYVYYYFKAIKQTAEQRATGTTFKELSGSAFSALPFALPPLNEQRRIVKKIEAMFERIDRGVENLRAARTTLALYRQSLLKFAFEGRLTESWRAKNADKLEDPKTLLARIGKERDARHKAAMADWQTALTDWRDGGEEGKKPAKPKRPRNIDFVGVDLKLQGWTQLPLGLMIDTPSYGTSKKCAYDGGAYGVLRIPNINAGAIDATDLKMADFGEYEVAQYSLIEGDILTVRSNGSLSIVGKPAIVSAQDTAHLFAGYLIRLRTLPRSLLPQYLAHLMTEPQIRGQIEDKAKSTSGVNNISAKELQDLMIPICSPAEQTEITRILDARLDAADAMESEIDAALARAEALRQSILKRAFSGKLVPQDPTDEPASALLARIKAEKAERTITAKSDRKTTPPRTLKARKPTLTDLIEVLEKQKNWIPASQAAQELGISDGASSDEIEAFYRELKKYVESATINVERRGEEDWLRLAKAEVG